MPKVPKVLHKSTFYAIWQKKKKKQLYLKNVNYIWSVKKHLRLQKKSKNFLLNYKQPFHCETLYLNETTASIVFRA